MNHDAMGAERRYRLSQLYSGRVGNRPADGLESLVTHHPIANVRAYVEDGVVQRVENSDLRSYGVIGGEVQEVETRLTDVAASAIRPDQVLLIKDFILEDSNVVPFGYRARDVDVPAPFAGYVGRVNAAQGLVDIFDQEGGDLVARIRHMDPIAVSAGDTVEYGQALGVQHERGLPKGSGRHVHMEVDTRFYQEYENYIGDLVSGRLSIDPMRQQSGTTPRPVVDDGVVRIGEAAEIVRVVQKNLNAAGYTGADGQPLAEDGVYRLSMQKAVINYQHATGLPESGDLDGATLRHLAPPLYPPTVNPASMDSLPPYLQSQAAAAAPQLDARSDPLFIQAQQAMRQLESSLGRCYDEHSERMAASTACLAKENGLTRIDHIVLSQATATTPQGYSLFVVQGDLRDPAHLRAHMGTAEALAAPLDASLARLQQGEAGAAHHAQPAALDAAVQQDVQAQHRAG